MGSARHWSHVFAAPALRAPLLGIFALLAQWQALLDPATDRNVAQLKLAWWFEEMSRLVEGTALHPISLFLASQPAAAAEHFAPLTAAVQAAIVELSAVPLETGAELPAHSEALLAGPLRVASLIAGSEPGAAAQFDTVSQPDADALACCTRLLATAQYTARALQDYRRDAAVGRVPFAVDELLRAGVDNADLLAAEPAPHLAAYLDELRHRADRQFAQVPLAATPAQRSRLRHLLILAALGRRYLPAGRVHSRFDAPRDMLLAWATARRAIAGGAA